MPITLQQIPGFSDLADTNFNAETYALGINFARTVDNSKFGIVRPEVFVGRYINGDTVPLPTSIIDGYTYQREELSYAYSFALTGGTSTSSNGVPSQPGAIRYLAALVNQATGVVGTNVEYLVGDGSAPTITSDGTLTVFTFATRRLTSLVVTTPPVYSPVLDSEVATDAAVTDSIMKRVNRNAKFAALSAEIMYMGEFTDGETVPKPVSPADGYVYTYAEVTLVGFWRWTTQGDQLTDPTDPNHKQIGDLGYGIDPATGAFGTDVEYYHSGYYASDDGRMIVMAFCKRKMTPVSGSSTTQGLSGLGDGVINFTDLTVDLLSSGNPVREDVLERVLQNTRYSICRTEFFSHGATEPIDGNSPGTLGNGSIVPLPISPIDGYHYSREELTYVWGYQQTAHPTTAPRMYQWNCNVDQATGLVTSNIIRCPNGGAAVFSTDGNLVILVIARRDHVSNISDQYQYTGGGTGASDLTALLNGGFDSWFNSTDPAAKDWVVSQHTGAGYAAQAAGLLSPFSQRLGVGASGTTQTGLSTYPAAHNISVLSSSVTVASGVQYFMSWAKKPSGALSGGLTATVTMYSAVGDKLFFFLKKSTDAIPAGLSQDAFWFTLPKSGDTTVNTNALGGTSNILATVAPGTDPGSTAVALDFIPVAIRVEFIYNGALSTYIDLDEVTFITQLNPSIGQIASRGSNSLAFFPAIEFTVSDTTFTPDLDILITRVDGTTTLTADGSPVITGLTAGTTYNWLPYLNELTGHMAQIADSGAGTPPTLLTTVTFAQYAAWFAQGNLPLAAGAIQVITLASGAPPSGGSGGGSGGGGGGRPFPVLEDVGP